MFHQDDTVASVNSPPLVVVTILNQDNEPLSLTCEASALVEMQKAVCSDIEALRASLVVEGREKLASELNTAFHAVYGRIESFADWYFQYPTTYKLLLRAIGAAGRHVKNLGTSEKLTDAIQRELEEHICEQFLKIVLRPESSNTACSTAFKKSVDSSRDRFRCAVDSVVQQRVEQFCDAPGSTRLEVPNVQSELHLDWRSQSFKAQSVAAAHEKSPEMSALLVATGAVAGKAVSGKVAAAVGGKALSALSSKLSAPFAVKVITALGPGALSLGAAVAGPLGALSGAAAGIATDMLLNAGNELIQRRTFERDVREAVQATQEEWDHALGTQLELAVDEWCRQATDMANGWIPSLAK
eukprot:gnl/MRDRNA2_/MRDRNA2_238691_c0_seq1.p1 gnl/MRDRNA2_/MRDRNA2_238691_c0~~gnl/MRDRNA2_/MRDRNA2_238691_c0_seq1.p1  ORF type:complete len:406 (+),score=79.71 gnl/MRDRNA2_/MRDRNA2_238691_c0_seq1:153-1220(+)